MLGKNKILVLAAAFLCLNFAAACSDKSDGGNSSAAEEPVSVSESDASEDSAPDSAGSEDGEDSEAVQEEYTAGEYITAAAELFSGSYTYVTRHVYSDNEDVTIETTQVTDGENVYISSSESGNDGLDGNFVYLYTGSAAYNIDLNLKTYAETSASSYLNVVQSVFDYELEQTSTHIPTDTEGYIVEEYTYTGDTYITAYDFYFTEEGDLEKYTAVYSIEGDDDLVETVEIVSIEPEADESLFDVSVLDDLTDFNAMSEDERLGFCQGICGVYGISTDEMYELEITTDDLKRISFDDFFNLVYTYAKP